MHNKLKHPLTSAAGRRISSIAGGDAPELANVLERNIEAISEHKREADAARTLQERLADNITWFSGSLPFVYFHVVAFTAWIAVNLGLFGIPAFDPYPFGMLTTIVSLEAIFLSTFVLVSQNRQALIAERRTELDLHINLLSEYEITRILILAHDIAKSLKITTNEDGELTELKKDVKPEVLLRELQNRSTETAVEPGATDTTSEHGR